MRYHRLSLLSILAATLLAGPATSLPSHWGEMLVKHKWNDLPNNWVSVGHPANGTTIKLYIALKSERENALVDALYEVSQPEHPKYGAHLSKEQVAEIVAPHPDTLELVCSWLEFNGVPPSSISKIHGSWLTVDGVPVSRANEILGASYQFYNHAGTNETILRTAGYALPEALHEHIKTIVPTTAFTSSQLSQQAPRSSRSSGAATSGEPVNVLPRTPSLPGVPITDPPHLRWLYKTVGYTPSPKGQNTLGIVGFANEYPSPSPDDPDLSKFLAEFRKDATDPTITVVPVNQRAENLNNPSSLATMDIQYAVAMVYPIPVIYYALGGAMKISSNNEPEPDDPYFQWLFTLTKQEIIPQTISVGWHFDEQSIPVEYAVSLCFLFADLATRGITVLAASGDEGVGNPDKCEDESGNIRFYTTFPASCPYVTGVGGTISISSRSQSSIGIEFSGGGFSNLFPTPRYQKNAVNEFLRTPGYHTEWAEAGYFIPTRRGVPDIAMQAWEYQYVYQGITNSINSTRCSTIAAGAIFTLLNNNQLSQNNAALGWLNPFLYGRAISVFIDIALGANPGCGIDGFECVRGWDPVTGIGSPNFKAMLTKLDAYSPVKPTGDLARDNTLVEMLNATQILSHSGN